MTKEQAYKLLYKRAKALCNPIPGKKYPAGRQWIADVAKAALAEPLLAIENAEADERIFASDCDKYHRTMLRGSVCSCGYIPNTF